MKECNLSKEELDDLMDSSFIDVKDDELSDDTDDDSVEEYDEFDDEFDLYDESKEVENLDLDNDDEIDFFDDSF